jgi:selenocysteine-specific elongation factor
VLRSYSPVQTIGGGMVAEVARLRKRLSPEDRAQLQTILDGDVADRIRAVVALAGDAGAAIGELPISCGARATDVPSDVAHAGDRLFDPRVLNEAVQRLVRRVKRHHDAHPLERGMERAELLAELKPGLANAALSKAQIDGLLAAAGSIVSLPGFEPGFTPKQKVLRDQLVSMLRDAGLAPPSVPELTAALRSNEVRAVLRLLEAEGAVTAVSFDLYMDADILGRAIRAVRAAANDHALAAADFKTALPVSRKYLIPILEYLDRSGVTRREGDLRWVMSEGTPENA